MLAKSLEVSRRTILRDIDALIEAGLPVIMHRGNQGGVELGFGYRTRLTGLDADEAEAMGMLLSILPQMVVDLGMASALARAQAKLRVAFPDQTRAHMSRVQAMFPSSGIHFPAPDPRREALARAVRQQKVVRLRFGSEHPVVVHPKAREVTPQDWLLHDGLTDKR